MSYSYKCYSDTKDIMKKYVNAVEGAAIYGLGKTRIMALARTGAAGWIRLPFGKITFTTTIKRAAPKQVEQGTEGRNFMQPTELSECSVCRQAPSGF